MLGRWRVEAKLLLFRSELSRRERRHPPSGRLSGSHEGSGNNDAISWPGLCSYCTRQISRPYDLPFRVLDITNIYGSFLISVTAFGLVGYDIKSNYAENPATCVYESIDVIHNLSAEEEHRKHCDSGTLATASLVSQF